MGEFKNGILMNILMTTFSIALIGLNIFFCYDWLFNPESGLLGSSNIHWMVYVGIGLAAFIWFIFVIYLFVYMFITLGFENLVNSNLVQKLYRVEEYLDDCSPVSPIGIEIKETF